MQNNIHFFIVLVSFQAFFCSFSLAAESFTEAQLSGQQVELTEEQLNEIDNDIAQSAEPEFQDPGMKIDDMIAEYESSGPGQSFRKKADQGMLFYTTAAANVMVKPESRDWGNARVMAYKEALLKAQAKYIEFLGVSTTANSVSELFDDASQMPSFTEKELRSSNKLMELIDKAVAVTSGKLDEKLREMNIDPEEFNKAPREKRALLFERSVEEAVTTKARQSLTGVIPVKTFEAYSKEGDHVVAVAIVASEKFRQFVHDIARSKGDISLLSDKAASATIVERLRKDPTALINEFGIRRMYDEQGYPVLVSFGQSSNPYRGSDYQQRADSRELSFSYSKSQAYGNFAYLFNSMGASEQKSSQKMQNKRIGIVREEDQSISETEEAVVDFVSTMDREISARGSVTNLPGTKELFRWTKKHPMYGHEINGVVYIWHPVSEQIARDMRNFKPKNQAAEKTKKNTIKGQQGTSQSRDLMSVDDF